MPSLPRLRNRVWELTRSTVRYPLFRRPDMSRSLAHHSRVGDVARLRIMFLLSSSIYEKSGMWRRKGKEQKRVGRSGNEKKSMPRGRRQNPPLSEYTRALLQPRHQRRWTSKFELYREFEKGTCFSPVGDFVGSWNKVEKLGLELIQGI